LPQSVARVLQAAENHLCHRVSDEFDCAFGRRRSLGNIPAATICVLVLKMCRLERDDKSRIAAIWHHELVIDRREFFSCY
jgi:hypothetical protein